MVQASGPEDEAVAIAKAAVRDPANAAAIAALTDLLWAMHRSRLLHQQGTPAAALLVHLARTGPVRSSDLANDMRLALSTVSRHLAHLESEGLVIRSPDLQDGRAHLVDITTRGRARAAALIASRVHELEAVIDAWSTTDRDDLARLLRRFTTGFEARLHPLGVSPASPAQPTATSEESP